MRSWSSHRPLGFLLILHFLGIIQEAFQWPLHYPLKGEKLPKETYEKQEKEFQGKFEDAFKNGAERLRTIEAYRDNFSKLLVQTMSKNSQFKVNHLEKWMNKLKEFLKKLEVVDDAQIKEDPLKTWFSRLETDLTEEKGKAHDHDFIKNGYEPVIYFSNGTFTEEMMNALMGQEFWSKGRNFYLASVHSVFDTIEMCIEETSCIEKEKGKTEDSRNYAMVRANKVRMKVLLAMVFQMLDSNMENKPTGEGEDKTKEEGKDTEDDKAADSQNHSTTKGSWLKRPIGHIENNRFKYGLGSGAAGYVAASYVAHLASKWNPFAKYSGHSSIQPEGGKRTIDDMTEAGTLPDSETDDSSLIWIICLLLLVAVGVGITLWWVEPWNNKSVTEQKETHEKQKESKKVEKMVKRNTSKKKAPSKKPVQSTLPSSDEASSSIILREGAANASGVRKSVYTPSVDSPVSKINSKVTRSRYCDEPTDLPSPTSKMSPVVPSSVVSSSVAVSSRTPISTKSNASSVVPSSTPKSSQ